jgi:hypothetical protein
MNIVLYIMCGLCLASGMVGWSACCLVLGLWFEDWANQEDKDNKPDGI